MQAVLCTPQHNSAAAAENAVRDRIGKGRVLERKPISSVLDKILSRKQEVQARSVYDNAAWLVRARGALSRSARSI